MGGFGSPFLLEASMIGIKYIGNREMHSDNLYGTKLEFTPGQIHNVDDVIAKRMLAHTDTYAEAKPVKNAPVATPAIEAPKEQTEPLPHLDGMGKPELIAFAQQHYGEKLHHAMSEDNMRSKVLGFIQARGR